MPTSYRTDNETADRIENTFKHHPPFGNQNERYNVIREQAKALAYLLVSLTPKSREQSLALTHLEEVTFFANAAIARHEQEPPKGAELQKLITTYGGPAFAGRYGGHDPNELPGLDESEQAGGDPIKLTPIREPNRIPA